MNAYDYQVARRREFERKWRDGEHTCRDRCVTHAGVVCACAQPCRPCKAAAS